MKVGIVGSRKRQCKAEVEALVEALPDNAVVVSGGCRGVDTWAVDAAKARGLRTEVFSPQPKGPGYKWACRAYTERNKKIGESVDVLHAFPATNRKGGTEQTIRFAEKQGVPVILH